MNPSGVDVLAQIQEALRLVNEQLRTTPVVSPNFIPLDAARGKLWDARIAFETQELNKDATELAGRAEELEVIKEQLEAANEELEGVGDTVADVAAGIGTAVRVVTTLIGVLAV